MAVPFLIVGIISDKDEENNTITVVSLPKNTHSGPFAGAIKIDCIVDDNTEVNAKLEIGRNVAISGDLIRNSDHSILKANAIQAPQSEAHTLLM